MAITRISNLIEVVVECGEGAVYYRNTAIEILAVISARPLL